LQPVEEQGYVIVAVNSDTVDYGACAARLARSIKHFHPTASVCLITDIECNDPCYDHVRQLVPNVDNAYANDSQIFKLTPYRETIKLEADMLIVSKIDHWWSLLRHRDVVISTGCRDWKDRVSDSVFYRKCFVENDLPDVYNAITYWRRSALAKQFFDCVSSVFNNWHTYRKLIKFADEVPSTDLVYAIAAQIIGPELCTMPWATYPRIVHMKQHHAKIQSQDWTQELVWESDPVRIQTVAQWGAFHYHVKDWQP
jgi:hypothetical protein